MVKKETSIVASRKNLLKDIKKEIDNEYVEQIRNHVKKKYKEVQMAKIIYNKLKKELDEMTNGKKKFTEEGLLFNDDDE